MSDNTHAEMAGPKAPGTIFVERFVTMGVPAQSDPVPPGVKFMERFVTMGVPACSASPEPLGNRFFKRFVAG